MMKFTSRVLCLFVVAGFPAFEASAQDVIKPSVGMQRAATSLNNIPASRYNVKAGPVSMLFNASMGAGYNSNVNVSEDDPQGSFFLQPRVGMGVYWPITKLNKLQLNVQVGYDYYFSNPDLNTSTILISPTTEFLFNLFIGDVMLTLYERPSITNNPLSDPSLSGVDNYTIFNNTAGLDLVWDLNDVMLGLGYSNFFQYAINDDYSYQNRVANQVYANGSFLLLPYLRVGLEGSVSSNVYLSGASAGGPALNDSMNYTIGGTVSGNISRYLDWSSGVGWQIADFNESNNPLNTGNYSDPYFYLTVNHSVNQYFSHRVTSGFEAVPSAVSNFVQLFYVRYGFNWMLIRDWSLGGSAFYESGVESPGPNTEDFNRVGANLALTYQLTKHWVASIYFGWISKGSTVLSDGYNQQVGGLNLTYNF